MQHTERGQGKRELKRAPPQHGAGDLLANGSLYPGGEGRQRHDVRPPQNPDVEIDRGFIEDRHRHSPDQREVVEKGPEANPKVKRNLDAADLHAHGGRHVHLRQQLELACTGNEVGFQWHLHRNGIDFSMLSEQATGCI